MKTLFLMCLLAAAAFGAWKYDMRTATPEQRPVVASPRRQPAVKPTPAPKVARPKGKLAPKTARTKIATITNKVEEVRGLGLRRPVEVRFLTQEELAVRWKIDMKRHWPEHERLADEKAMVAFGFMSARSDLSKLVDESVGEGIAGFYEFDSKGLFVIGDHKDLGAFDQVTIAHEITHAMQDQTYDLDGMFARVEKDDDRALVLRALVEGDAMLSESLYQGKARLDREELMVEAAEESLFYQSYREAPPVLGLTALFPYVQGAEWVRQLHDRQGWSGVNAAYKRLPASTEQILHPEKYTQGDQPVSVKLPNLVPVLGKGWKQLHTNTLGEYQALVLVSGGDTSQQVYTRAAAGWEGDKYGVYSETSGAGSALVWESRWETEKDATEFTVALAKLHEALNQNVYGEQLKRRNGGIALDGADASVRIRRVGKQVYLVVARDAEPKLADKLLTRLAN